MSHRKRVLFIAEAVTLAHVARPMVLATALDPDEFEVVFACDPRYRAFLPQLPWTIRQIYSIGGDQFLDALAHGRPVYDARILRRYVRDDLALIGEIRPDLIVGDFRLSLSVSARKAGIPYAAITNAYWSPYAKRRFPLPEHPMTKVLGLPAAKAVFRAVRPLVFAYHTLPLSRVRREYGLSTHGLDLCRTYTDADLTLYADVPELIPTVDLPPSHIYLGPVLWSPSVKLPEWWERLPQDRPIIYLTMGSSGRAALLPMIFDALAGLPCVVVAATAGGPIPDRVPANVFAADYLPGDSAVSRATLVICNGGSPTSQQALAAGVPVLGIASNMDQFLNMEAVERLGAGKLLRADCATSTMIQEAVMEVRGSPQCAAAATRLAQVFQRYPARERFASLVANALGGSLQLVECAAPLGKWTASFKE